MNRATKKTLRLRKRDLRTNFLLTLLLAIGCLAGCMVLSPTRQTVNEASSWQEVAEQLKRTNSANLNDDLNKILRPIKHSEGVKAFRQLAQSLNSRPNGRSWLVGRAYLFAGVAYISAAQIALTNLKTQHARQFCSLAAENFVKASQHLPPWEQKSALRWASQLKQIAGKLDTEPFYALTHLKALAIKAKSHAKFVPPVGQGR